MDKLTILVTFQIINTFTVICDIINITFSYNLGIVTLPLIEEFFKFAWN